ncbi:MAG: hypothetical protein GY953_22855, partial [bacterium]|nr:hypothetical protein [bacterium]
MPKTGGTFVRNMLFRLHGVRHPTSRFSWRRAKWALAGGNMAGDNPYGPLWHRSSTQHAACSQIPPEHSGKLILGCVRNPFDWYVSAYEFGWWRSHPPARWRAAFPELRRELPRFPDLSFTEFVETDWQSVLATTGRDDIGAYTARFVHYFFRNPGSAIASL